MTAIGTAEPGSVTPSQVSEMTSTRATWAQAISPNAIAYPASRSSLPSGIAISRSSVPRARSRWVVIAATMNMITNGNTPMYSGASRFSSSGLAST